MQVIEDWKRKREREKKGGKKKEMKSWRERERGRREGRVSERIGIHRRVSRITHHINSFPFDFLSLSLSPSPLPSHLSFFNSFFSTILSPFRFFSQTSTEGNEKTLPFREEESFPLSFSIPFSLSPSLAFPPPTLSLSLLLSLWICFISCLIGKVCFHDKENKNWNDESD